MVSRQGGWYKLTRLGSPIWGWRTSEVSNAIDTATSSMNRRDLVLAILAAAEGRAYTPVQIQKAVFVICDQLPHLIDDGPRFNFAPYDYGPFDGDVYTEIAMLQGTELGGRSQCGKGAAFRPLSGLSSDSPT
jgi:hypothetical protein